jgi:hypothetical protein
MVMIDAAERMDWGVTAAGKLALPVVTPEDCLDAEDNSFINSYCKVVYSTFIRL